MRWDCMPKVTEPEPEPIKAKSPKIEFIRGDEFWSPCLYFQTRKGQHYVFFKWFSIKYLFHEWS